VRAFVLNNKVQEKAKPLYFSAKNFRFVKTEVNLSFGLKPDFRSGLSFGVKSFSRKAKPLNR